MTSQSGILPSATPHARFLVLKLGELPVISLKQQVQELEAGRRRLQATYPDARLYSTIAFGPALWMELRGRGPKELRPLVPIRGRVEMPATGGDVLLHIRGDRADLCFALLQSFLRGIASQVRIIDDVTGFKYLDGRDLTGFIDGTENPQGEAERARAALIGSEDRAHSGGSYVFAQRFVHDLEKWQRLKVDAQELVIGRSKLESIELDDERKPENAHIARMVVEEDGEELKILRHSLPYGGGSEAGLFFIAYARSPLIVDKMLARMFGTSGDGVHDRLLKFVTPVTGGYFFAPAQEMLETVLGTGA